MIVDDDLHLPATWQADELPLKDKAQAGDTLAFEMAGSSSPWASAVANG
jgi:hypothetical protein